MMISIMFILLHVFLKISFIDNEGSGAFFRVGSLGNRWGQSFSDFLLFFKNWTKWCIVKTFPLNVIKEGFNVKSELKLILHGLNKGVFPDKAWRIMMSS